MAEIDIVKETKNLEDYWQERNAQMMEDREMLHLIKPIQRQGQPKWVSNEPKVAYETSVALISSYSPRFRMPLTINFEEEEKGKMSKAERLLVGVFRTFDARQFARGQSYWLREFAYWLLSGWYSVFNVVRSGDKGVEFIADLWDPMTVYPEWDADGLVKCARTFETDKKTAMSMVYAWQAKGLKTEFKEPSRNIKIKIINYWLLERGAKKNKVYNAIYVAGQPIKPLTLTEFDHIPIHIGTVGVPERGTENWKKRVGENFIASNRDMHKYENEMISLMIKILTATAYPNIITSSQSGAPVVKAEDFRGDSSVIPIKLNEKIELMKHAATPAEALQLLSWIGKQRQKGSIPDIVFGGVPFELSGFAISQLMAAIRYKIAPYLNTMQYVMGQIGSDSLHQYKKGKFPKITLSTTNPKELEKGLFFVEEFKPSDVPESSFVEVTIPITSALDKTQQILFARQALSPPQLLSRQTIWDEVLDVQDSEQEYARILQDEMLEDPMVKQIGILEQLRQRVELYKSKNMTAEANALKRYIMMLEMQLGMRKGIPTAPGVPSQVSPPEMGAVGISPDVLGAVAGKGPSGLRRPPQTPEQRAERGAAGRTIISPTGETLVP